MRVKLLLLMSLASASVHSGESASLLIEPSHPVAGQPVEAVVRVPPCTMLPEFGTVTRNGATVVLALEIPDYCVLPQFIAERRYPIAAFAPGDYTLELHYCGNPPPPLPRCGLITASAFSVGGSQVAVPAISRQNMYLLAVITMLAGLAASATNYAGRLRAASSARGRGWAKRKPWP